MKIWVSGFAMLLVLSPMARAASFDCAKAVTPQEKAICGDTKLSAMDSEMATAYQTALDKVSERARKEMRSDQGDWLQWMATVCRAAQPQAAADLTACMSRAYRERTEILTSAVMQKGSVLFYMRSRYVESSIKQGIKQDDPMPDAGDYKGFEAIRMAWPQADETGPPFTVWNRAAAIKVSGFSHGGGDELIRTEVKSATSSRISILISDESMGHTAAHPETAHAGETWKNFHWLLKENREMLAGDVFRTDTPWKAALAQRCWAGLKEQFPQPGTLSVSSPRDGALLEVVSNTGNWEIKKEGLVISFPEYSVAPRASGVNGVNIPWAALKAYVLPGFDPAS